MKRTLNAKLGLLCATMWYWPAALTAQEVIDQQSTNILAGIYQESPLGQRFAPSLNTLNFVDLFHVWFGSGTATFIVNIHAETITGPVLGTSTILNLNPEYGPVRFNFDAPVSLTPAQTYVLEVTQTSPGFAGAFNTSLGTGGMFLQGQPTSETLWFREGVVVVPEPGTGWLCGLGIVLVAVFRKRCRLAFVQTAHVRMIHDRIQITH